MEHHTRDHSTKDNAKIHPHSEHKHVEHKRSEHPGHHAVEHKVERVKAPANTKFTELGLIEPLQRAVSEEGYTTPTPIQEQSIPHLIEGRDILGCAQTGTGKTAAFVLPILHKLWSNKKISPRGEPRALILAPTRELAAQIGDSIKVYGRHLRLFHTVIFGGVGQHPQVQALNRGVDILVATPGRLLDLMNQGYVRLNGVEIFVLDEADRMLDMGFLPDIRKIIAKLPEKKQALFFSATLAPEVVTLAKTLVHKPVHVTIEPEKPTVEKITQAVYFVDRQNKDQLLLHLVKKEAVKRVVVFTLMKHVANKVVEMLNANGVRAEAIHGNKSQAARTAALKAFKTGRVRVLVATDIAARGIDIDDVTHVINYELPNEAETYVHRIGRTARAGAEGDAVTLCSAPERDYLRAIERLIHINIPVENEHEWHSEFARTATGAAARPPPKKGWGGGGRHTGKSSHRSSGPRRDSNRERRDSDRSGSSRGASRASYGRDGRSESSGRSSERIGGRSERSEGARSEGRSHAKRSPFRSNRSNSSNPRRPR